MKADFVARKSTTRLVRGVALACATILLARVSTAAAGADGGVLDGDATVDTEQRFDRMESQIREQQQQIDDLKAQLEMVTNDVSDEAAEEFAQAEAAAETFDRRFKIYGFFDVGLFHSFIDEDEPMHGLSNTDFTFTMTNLNVYLSSRMTEDWSALVELRFTFLPHGQEILIPFERIDTTVTDAISNEELELGGVVIERAVFTWQPRDWFAVTGGRFITPFGIWNVEHGAPVLIPMFPPVMTYRHIVPLAQTGLQIHGQLYPARDLYLQYALTLSNGRGPADSVYDLDKNKAVGLRLKLRQIKGDLDWHIGGYGYFGEYTDKDKTLIPTIPFDIEVDVTENYKELTGHADFLFTFHGVRFQAEYVRRLVRYDERPRRRVPIINDAVGPQLQPDYISWDVYALLAWELPLERFLGEAVLTPFVLGEYSVLDDSNPNYETLSLVFGLNFKPNSYIVLKALGSRVAGIDSIYFTKPIWSAAAQVAVTF